MIAKYLKSENFILYSIAVLFIAITSFFIFQEKLVVLIVPFALIIALIAIFSFDKLFYIAVFFTPLSLTIKYLFGDIGVDLYLPTEILFIGISFIFVIKTIVEKKIEKAIIFHPVSITIYIYIIWLLITTITSTLPLVSVKFVISKLWFIIPVYFMGIVLFKQTKNIKLFLWLYLFALLIVVIYTTIRHLKLGFNDIQIAHFVMYPFYKDHTAYGAILAMMLPPAIGLLFRTEQKSTSKIFIAILVILLIIALVLSYSRAAWISLLGSGAVWLIIRFRIKLRYILLAAFLLLVAFLSFRFEIIDKMEKNKQDSSEQLSEQVKSISNIATDASNLERLNRWNCAFKMFKEKPFFGWGPGTYMFQYAPFQKHSDRTIISTNFGTRGNAHSEYIGPLAEAGVLGSLTFILIVIFTLKTALKVYRKVKDKELKMFVISCTLGLITYYLHGILNNFLDTDKLSVPFWGFTAIIVAIDIYYSKQNENILNLNQEKNENS